MGICVLRPSALGHHLVGPRFQNIARLKTILLFNFEVVITIKLSTKYFYFLVFVLIINYAKSKKLQNNDRLQKDRRVIHRVTSNDNEWHNKWQQVVQRMTTSDIEWYNEWQRVRTRVTKNDEEWQRMTASDKTNEYEWE